MARPNNGILILGARIRAARIDAGITLRALARGMGVSAPFLSDVEHGRRPLSEKRIRDCAAVLSIKPNSLLDVSMPKDAAASLERDPELLRALRWAMRDRRVRLAVIEAAKAEVS